MSLDNLKKALENKKLIILYPYNLPFFLIKYKLTNSELFKIDSEDTNINSNDSLILDSGGLLELNSSNAAINIGNGANSQPINIGNGSSNRIITIGNITGSTGINLNSGTSGINAIGVHNITPSDDSTTEMVVIDSSGELGSMIRFPQLIEYFSDNTLFNTSSTVLQTVFTRATGTLVAGVYSLQLSYSWNHRTSSNDFESVLTWDTLGTPIVLGELGSSGVTHKQEPKDNSGNVSGTGSSQQYGFSKLFIIDPVSAGSKTFTLQYRTDTASTETSMWNVAYILTI